MVSEVFPEYIPKQEDINKNFAQCMWILHQYRGSVVGLQPLVVRKWKRFDDNGYGLVRHGGELAHRPTPYFDDTYTLEMGKVMI